MNIPFIANCTERPGGDKGVRASLFINSNEATAEKKSYDANGLWIAGILNSSGDFSGVELTGVISVPNDFKGIRVTGIANYSTNSTGVEVAGVTNVTGELSGVSIAPINYAESNGRFALQIGLANYIRDYDTKGLVIQVGGLHNRVGDQSCPLLNIRGVGNFFKRRKQKKLEILAKED